MDEKKPGQIFAWLCVLGCATVCSGSRKHTHAPKNGWNEKNANVHRTYERNYVCRWMECSHSTTHSRIIIEIVTQNWKTYSFKKSNFLSGLMDVERRNFSYAPIQNASDDDFYLWPALSERINSCSGDGVDVCPIIRWFYSNCTLAFYAYYEGGGSSS